VRSTIDLARNLGLRVVAEGVETEQAWRMLAALDCAVAQGYWLARPQPVADLLPLMTTLQERLRGRLDVPTPA
jgi:EAL domain-containing protein (putative c-di-GMP-specific phosphodiesterase class I)